MLGEACGSVVLAREGEAAEDDPVGQGFGLVLQSQMTGFRAGGP